MHNKMIYNSQKCSFLVTVCAPEYENGCTTRYNTLILNGKLNVTFYVADPPQKRA